MSVRAWGQTFVQGTMPAEAPVMVGSLWVDTANTLLKQCTSISPYTFSTISGGGGGLGDVVGPASSADGHIARFSGTTGKLLQEGGLIADADVLAGAAIAWTKLSKTGSSLADLTTRSAADLSSGIIPDARIPGLTTDGVSKIEQLAFIAAQVGSSGVNVLDDYEEGSFNATFTGSGGGSGQVYTRQGCHYVKIGKLVWVGGRVTVSTLGTITGTAQIGGLPFTSDASQYGVCISYWAGLSGKVFVGGLFNGGGTAFDLYGAGAAQTGLSNFTSTDLTNTTDIAFNLCYRASA